MRKLRVVAGLDLQERQTLDQERRRARPILREYVRRVKLAVMAGELPPIAALLAEELVNYPSANHGRCYASQARLGKAIGVSDRWARQALKLMIERRFLSRKRGGPGKTATWFFECNGRSIFADDAFLPISKLALKTNDKTGLDQNDTSGLDRNDRSAKPCLTNQYPIEQDPPLTPTLEPAARVLGGAVAEPPETNSLPTTDQPLDGEIVVGEISFQEFWIGVGRRGPEGFARAEWRKLSLRDKVEIADYLNRPRRTSRNIFAGTFLRDRVWQEPDDQPEVVADDPCPLAAMPRTRTMYALPGSPEWRTERERLRQAGLDNIVTLMDDRAAAGKGWTVAVPI